MLVSIDQCHFRGTQSAIAKARKALDHARFPVVGDAEYIILRELNVSAELSRLEQHYFRQSEKIIAARVNGWSESAATADCIWFASETDLYACLSRDIAHGRAANLWFWKSFSHFVTAPVSASLASLFQQQGRQLASLIVQLYRHRQLKLVWRKLSQADADSVLQAVVPATVGKIIQVRSTEPELSNTGLSEHWMPPMLEILLDGEQSATGSVTPRQQLAIALYLLAEKPHWLFSPHIDTLVGRLKSRVFVGTTILDASSGKIADQEGTGVDQYRQSSLRSSGTPYQTTETIDPLNRPDHIGNEFNEFIDASGEAQAATGESSGHLWSITASDQQESIADSYGQTDRAAVIDARSDRQGETPSRAEWHVAQGGIFYLLNILNQPLIREQLFADEQAVAFPSGWGWLYRLGEAFGLARERELVRCLSLLSGVEEKKFLALTPDLDAAPGILDYAKRCYARYGFWKSDLLNKPAHIAFVRPELTITFLMQDIDIGLRKAGLDIDPGWIDWLGTLVRFNYRETL